MLHYLFDLLYRILGKGHLHLVDCVFDFFQIWHIQVGSGSLQCFMLNNEIESQKVRSIRTDITKAKGIELDPRNSLASSLPVTI